MWRTARCAKFVLGFEILLATFQRIGVLARSAWFPFGVFSAAAGVGICFYLAHPADGSSSMNPMGRMYVWNAIF